MDKDIVRRYWQARQSELNQIRGGEPLRAKKTRDAAEKFKSLYPEINFTTLPDEKIVLNLSSKGSGESVKIESRIVDSVLGNSSVKGLTPIKEIIPDKKQVAIKNNNSTTNPTIQAEPKGEFTKLYEKYDASRAIIKSESKLNSMFSDFKPHPSILPQRPMMTKTNSGILPRSTIHRRQIIPTHSAGSTIPKSVGPKLNSFIPTRSNVPSSTGILPIIPSGILSQNSPGAKSPSLGLSGGGGGPKATNRITNFTPTANAAFDIFKTRRKKVGWWLELNKNTTKKKQGKVKYRRNFVGNVKGDNIVGLFRRQEITEDRHRISNYVNDIVEKDKSRKLKSKKFNIFSSKKGKFKI